MRVGEEHATGIGDDLILIEANQHLIDSADRQHAAIRRTRLGKRVDHHLARGANFSAGKWVA